MRLLYLINDPYEGYQVGYRAALDALVNEGFLDEVLYYPHIVREKELGSWSRTLSQLLGVIQEFKPTAVLVAHLSKDQSISPEYLHRVKGLLGHEVIFAYDERDVYGWVRKPLPSAVLNFASLCDVVFLVAGGRFAQRFLNRGCAKVVYLPHVADTIHFGNPWNPTMDRRFDVVMVGNRLRSRVPFLSMPGVKEREELARSLFRSFGSRFGLFGNNWEGFGGNQGHSSFFEQEEILRMSWLSIGFDHFHTFPLYFSDRLPIALMSGVAHITKYMQGLETLFTDGKELKWFHSVKQGVELCEEMIAWPREDLVSLGLRGQNVAKKLYTENVRMRRIVDLIHEIEIQKRTSNKLDTHLCKSHQAG